MGAKNNVSAAKIVIPNWVDCMYSDGNPLIPAAGGCFLGSEAGTARGCEVKPRKNILTR